MPVKNLLVELLATKVLNLASNV